MRKAKLFIVIVVLTFCLFFLISGLYSPSWSQNHSNKNFPNYNTLKKSSNSYTWSRIWEVDISAGEKIITDLSNNVYIAGKISRYEDSIFNIKFDKHGHEQWNITWKLPNNTYCHIVGLLVDTQQNIYNLVKHYYPEDISILMKINNTGKSDWNITIAGTADCIYLDKHENIYISGYIFEGKGDLLYIYLKKFNKNGISQWNHTFLMDKIIDLYGFPCTIMVDHLNQTYMAGILSTNGFKDNDHHQFGSYYPAPLIFTCIYNSTGNLISYNMWRILDYYISTSMIFDTSYNLYLIGADRKISHNIILKYNSSGYLQYITPAWQKDAIVDSSEFWEFITLDSLNNIYCVGTNHYYTGMFHYGKFHYELYIAKFHNEGNLELDGAWNHLSNVHCYDIYIDSNFSMYLTGTIDKRTFILKNPILGEFTNPTYININMIITLTTIFCVCGIIGIYFYIRFKERSLQ